MKLNERSDKKKEDQKKANKQYFLNCFHAGQIDWYEYEEACRLENEMDD